ncbi:tetratricopeptide repeat protein [Pseudanabaena sp. PCC 6802]|uniref:tetratricopeptide repeat protein n=1 Tax=Pseudanabaena sp. PCC 6802 TaxID=118173 RepID=UPI001CEC12DF|nr:tetratricopeptide repeat protein [Pseudanabaena sp. PCC 6802]
MGANQDAARMLLQQGIGSFRSEEYQEYLHSFLKFERALELEPENAVLWGWRGIVLTKMWLILPLNDDRRALLPPQHSDTWIAAQDSLTWKPALERERAASFDRLLAVPPTTAELHQVRAEHSLWLGDCIHNNLEGRTNAYLEALQSIERAIALALDNPDMWVTRIKVLEKLSRFDEAYQSAERVLELVPEDYINWNKRASLLLWNLSRPQDALNSYNRVLFLAPETDGTQRLRAYRGRGIALEQLGRDEEALESYERSLQYGGSDSHSRAKQLRQKIQIKQLEERTQAHPDDWEAWYARGKESSKQEDRAAAVQFYDRALAIQPDLAEVWLDRGTSLFELGRYNDVLASCDRAIALDERNAKIWILHGLALRALKCYDDAIAAFDRALEHSLSDDSLASDAWCKRGDTLFRLQRYEDAIASYTRAAAVATIGTQQLEWINYKRGVAAIELERFEEAFICHYLEGNFNSEELQNVAQWLTEPALWSHWGNKLICNNDDSYTAAIIVLSKALDLGADPATQLEHRAYAFLKLERYTEAVSDYERLLALKPEDRDAWFNRAWSLKSLKRYEEALESYDRAIALLPEPYAHYHHGSILVELHRYDEALISYDRGLAIDVNHHPSFYGKALLCAIQDKAEDAIANLTQAIEIIATKKSNSIWPYHDIVAGEPRFDLIRDRPEFQNLMARSQEAVNAIFGLPSGFYPTYPSGNRS